VHRDGTAFGNIFNRAHVVVIVYDTSRQNTFDSVAAILSDTRKSLLALNSPAAILLFGNVSDEHARTVQYDTAKRYANSCGMIYIEGTATSEESVDLAFARLAVECLNLTNNNNNNNSYDDERNRSKCSIM
jgi:hypothetical protein